MKNRILTICVMLMAAMPGLAFAQYNFDAILTNLPARLDTATVNNWSAGSQIWQYVVPNGPGVWRQLSATFPNQDHTGDGIDDDDQLALLAKILNNDPCTRALLGDAKMNAIQAAYATNFARVQQFELTICLEIFNSTRISARLDTGIIGCVTLSDRPAWMGNTNITTGSPASLCMTVDTGIFLVGNYSQCFDADIPSLWGPDGILDSVQTGFSDDIANLLAAWLTIGDQNNVDYMQALIAQVFARGVLPNIATIILGAIGKSAAESGWDLDERTVEYGINAKNYDLPAQPNINIDITFSPPYRIPLGDGCGGPDSEWVEIIRFVGRILGTCVENGLQGWLWNYQVNQNGFVGYPAWLAASGNLNEVGAVNAISYTNYGRDRTSFFLNEWAGYPTLGFNPQPQSPVGALIYGGPNWTFNAGLQLTPAGLADVIQPTSYQWQWWNGTAWENIPGATSLNWTLPLNFLGTRSYRVIVTAPAPVCGTATSSTATVTVEPPPINITDQPDGGTVIYGDNFTLTVAANIAIGALSYQWQLNSIDIPGATGTSYQIVGADFADEGFYRCVISADSFPGHQRISDAAFVDVVAPPINVTVQPTGATIPEGGSHTLQTDATIAIGGLTYQWQLNSSDIPGATGKIYDITNADGDDQGNYRCRIASDTFPGHFTYSNTVFVRVGTALVVYVDQQSPAAPGTEDGLSWDTAFKTIQEGVDAAWAAGGGEVWVAGGPEPGGYVYNEVRTEPWGNPPVTGSLVLKDGVELYGGFEGYWGRKEVTRSQRGVRRAVTVIDGGTARGGLPAYHVVVTGKQSEASGGVRLDGFDIRGGNASGTAGAYHTWRGGGVYNWLSSPVIANCTFYANVAAVSGGAIANEGIEGVITPAPEIVNCAFFQNHADRQPDGAPGNAIRGGGAIFDNFSAPMITYCTITQNSLGTLGYTLFGDLSGGIYDWESTPVVNSSIVWANVGGGIQSQGALGSPNVASVSWSDVQLPPPVGPGPGNISVDPVFLTPLGPEFELAPVVSPCIDTGDPALPAPLRDLPGAPRPLQAGVDMGAYEFVPAPPTAMCLNIDVTLDENSLATVTPQMVRDPAMPTPAGGLWRLKIDNGGVPGYSLTFYCADLGPQPVTLTVIDYHGQTDTCVATVTVHDEELPVPACKDLTVQLDGSGSASITPQDVDDGSTDNCGIDWGSSTVVPSTFDCDDIASSPITATLTVVDVDGNSDTCLAQITVEDNAAPVMACKNITVDLDASGNASITTADVDDGTTDNCDTSVDLSLDIDSFTCANLGPNTVVLTGEDDYANSDTCSATVTVRDVTPAVITLNGAAYIEIPKGDPYVELGAVADDACDGQQPAVVGGDVVDTNTLGFYNVDYDYTDGSGNVSTTVTRTVRVVPRPVITIIGANPATVECKGVYNDDGATAFDDIDGDLTASIITTGLPVDTTYTGNYPVVYSVTNSFGVTTEETRIVQVVDSFPPTFTILGPTTFYVVQGNPWTPPPITASDDCDGPVVQFNLVYGGDYPVDTNTVGDYVVTYDLADYYGNSAPTQYVTVHVIESLLYFPVQPQDDEAYVDDPAFDLSAEFAGGYNATTYEWSRVEGSTTTPLGSQPVAGSVLNVTVDPAALGVGLYQYFVEVTDEIGTTPSERADVTIANHMSIADDIEDAEVIIGSSHSMSIVVDGGLGTLGYQWYKDDGAKVMQPLSDGGNISGSGAATLTIDPFNAEDAGDYQVIVSDNYESIPSSVATLTASAGVPAAGALGLAVLSALSALGGAMALRRRK